MFSAAAAADADIHGVLHRVLAGGSVGLAAGAPVHDEVGGVAGALVGLHEDVARGRAVGNAQPDLPVRPGDVVEIVVAGRQEVRQVEAPAVGGLAGPPR